MRENLSFLLTLCRIHTTDTQINGCVVMWSVSVMVQFYNKTNIMSISYFDIN